MCRPGLSDSPLTPKLPTDRQPGLRLKWSLQHLTSSEVLFDGVSGVWLSWPNGSLAVVGYREFPPPTALRDLVECAWVVDGPPEPVRVLPDGCMDLMRMDGRIMVAGPDTTASVSPRDGEPFVGLRFHPGVLPRLLGVPASELRNERVPLPELRNGLPRRASLTELAAALASEEPRAETAPWSLPLLSHVTGKLAAGSAVADVAGQVGWSARTLQRQCTAVYGYGPATLRRILRFRRAVRLLSEGLPSIEVAALAGYADQPHLHREVRGLAGVPLATLRQESSSANRSTQLPSGSATVA
jgi:AraC-like DNA-binding protein